MRKPYLEVLIDGRRQRIADSPLLSSAQTAWSGFLLERHTSSPAGHLPEVLYPRNMVVLVLAGTVSIEDRSLAGRSPFVAGPGSVTIWPRGHQPRSHSWTWRTQPRELLIVEAGLATLARLARGGDALERVELIPQPGIEDPALAMLLRLMEAYIAAGCPTGRLYGESLSLALAAHVTGRHSTAPAQAPLKGGLSRHQLRRVLDYVRAHLGGDLSLPELAGVAGLSPYHFARAFRTSVGMSPHQFVLAQRIAEARRLLAAQRLSVTDVALAVGFSCQSHFNDAFRRATGTTSRRYRQES
jgi:AraC family transcriptional regulator